MQGTWRQKYLRYKSFLLNTVDRYEKRADVRVYLEILLSLVTISVFSVFALRPTILTIAELIKEIEAKEGLITTLDNKIETITKAQILYDRQRDNINILKRAIPDTPENDTLIYQLEGVAGNSNVTVNKIGIGETILREEKASKKKNSSEDSFTNFNLQISGDYVSLYGFVRDLESLIKPISISGTSIISDEDEETGEVNLRLILSAQTPYLRINNSEEK